MAQPFSFSSVKDGGRRAANRTGSGRGCVLDGFEQVIGGERLRAGEVGDRARHLEDAVIGAGRQMQLFMPAAARGRAWNRWRSAADCAWVMRAFVIVRVPANACAAAGGGLDAGAIAWDDLRARTGAVRRRQGGRFDVEVDAVEQRTADAARNAGLCRSATAFVARSPR